MIPLMCSALLAACGAAQAGPDWPHLRGPTYDGVSPETGLAESWPPEGPPVLWRINLGQGYSSFAAIGGRLYTMTQSRSGQYVVCLDAGTGRELWRHRTNWPWKPDGDWPGPRATPTVHAGKVYFADAFGLAGCLDAARGRPAWSVNVTEKYQGVGTEFGYSCSPLVMDGKVFLPVGGPGASVVALDAKDGSVVWASGDEAASYSPALPVTVNGRKQVVVYLRNVVAGFDPATGRRLWESLWSEGYDEHSAWPVYEEPYLLTASAFRLGSRCLRLEANDAGGSARLAWESKEISNDVASSIVVRGHVYGFDLHELQPSGERPAAGLFKCIELATGRVCWSTDRTGHATVVAADGKLILLNESGELILARETPERYEELGRVRIFSPSTGSVPRAASRGPEMCWTQPILYQGRLYVRSPSQAACVYLGKEGGFTSVPIRIGMPPKGRTARSWLDDIWRGDSLTTPTLADVLRWFLFSFIGVLGVSVVLAWAAHALGAGAAARFIFYGAVFALGSGGTFLFSRFAGDFVFTWPAALFVACHLALLSARRPLGQKRGDASLSEAPVGTRDCPVVEGSVPSFLVEPLKEDGRAARRLSLAAALAFVALCLGYFWLCRDLFLLAGYGFLTGLALASPVEVVAAWKARGANRLRAELLWAVISFSVYFWASGLFTVWRTRL